MTNTPRASEQRNRITFWTGLGLIAFASVRNLILIRFSAYDLKIFPTVIPEGTSESARLTVTLMLIATGMVVLLWHQIVAVFVTFSWWLGRGTVPVDQRKVVAEKAPPRIRYDLLDGGGYMSLDTAKYMPRGSRPDIDLFSSKPI